MNQLHTNDLWRIHNLIVTDTGSQRILVTFDLLPPDETEHPDALKTLQSDATKLVSAVHNDELYIVLKDGSRLSNQGNYVNAFGMAQTDAMTQTKQVEVFKNVYIGLGVAVGVIAFGGIVYAIVKYRMNRANPNAEQ